MTNIQEHEINLDSNDSSSNSSAQTNSNQVDKFTNNSINQTDSDHIRMMWVLNLVWMLLMWLWIAFVIWYYFWKEKELWKNSKNCFYFMINFFISYTIYIFISFLFVFLIIWIVPLVIFIIMALVLTIIWFIVHLKWEPYEYFWSIRFFKPIE